MSENGKYTLAGKEYKAKDKYSMVQWGRIISLTKVTDVVNPVLVGAKVISDGNIGELLGLILTEPVKNVDQLMEEDVNEVSRLLVDFFTRK